MPQGLPLPTSLFLGPQDFSEWERVGFFPGSSLSFWGCCRCFLSLAPSPSSLLGCRPSFLGVFHHILSSFSTISLRNSWARRQLAVEGRRQPVQVQQGNIVCRQRLHRRIIKRSQPVGVLTQTQRAHDQTLHGDTFEIVD